MTYTTSEWEYTNNNNLIKKRGDLKGLYLFIIYIFIYFDTLVVHNLTAYPTGEPFQLAAGIAEEPKQVALDPTFNSPLLALTHPNR